MSEYTDFLVPLVTVVGLMIACFVLYVIFGNKLCQSLHSVSQVPQRAEEHQLQIHLDDVSFACKFSNQLTIGVARIFDWGGPKPQITCNDVIRNFQKRNFLLGKDIVEWKI